MKKLLAFLLVFGFAVWLAGAEQYAKPMIDAGAKPSDLLVVAIDSSSAAYSKIGEAVDTVLRSIVTARMGRQSTGVDTLVAAETLKTVLYACPTSGVTSVTIKNIDIVAMTPPAIPNNSSTKVAWTSIKNMDASDSAMHNIVVRKTLDSAAVVAMTAYLPIALTIDSTAFAVLYPGDIVYGFLCADTLCTEVREFNAILNLSINK